VRPGSLVERDHWLDRMRDALRAVGAPTAQAARLDACFETAAEALRNQQ